jgi:hypothetical protein
VAKGNTRQPHSTTTARQRMSSGRGRMSHATDLHSNEFLVLEVNAVLTPGRARPDLPDLPARPQELRVSEVTGADTKHLGAHALDSGTVIATP